MAAVLDGESQGKEMVPCARALHDFKGQAEHELNFSAGVSIRLMRRIDENWLEGKLDGKIGIFPANHVKIEAGSPTVRHQSRLANSGRPYAVALHSFLGTEAGDLTFNKGELIELLGDVNESAWIKGQLGSVTGIFPKSFVEILRYPEAKAVVADSPDNSSRRIPKPRVSPVKPHPLSISEVVDGSEHDPTSARQRPPRPAPTPPTLRKNPRSTNSVGVIPQPRPRKVRPRHTSADAAASPSLSRTSSSSSLLQTELEIEKKLLESAEGLLAAGKSSDGRSQKMVEAIHSHKDKIQSLTTQIAQEDETEVSHKNLATSAAPPPKPPPRPSLPMSTKDKQRIKVIEELLATERDFCYQVEFCVHRVIPAISRVEDVQVDCLFGNMSKVQQLSQDLLAELELACGQDNKKQAKVGEVFTSLAPQMKEVFGSYCHNHNAAAALYEKYLDTPTIADNMKQAIDELRGEGQSFGLQSMMIKPVQRLLKYPLLLQQLLKNTADTHPDHTHLHSAILAMNQMAQDINEEKRRKDLVVKYTAAKEDRRGTMSFHSLQKKMRRFQQSLTQSAGLRRKTIDHKFDELEHKVLSLDLLITSLIRNISSWQEELQSVMESYSILAEDTKNLCSTSVLTNYLSTLVKIQDIFKSQAEFVRVQVTTPLEELEALFHNPFVLIQKRKDKLLDFDSLQYQLDKSDDSEKIPLLKEEVLLAKRNYEALNVQLLEELPHLLQIATETVEHLLQVLLQAQHSFSSSVACALTSLLATCAADHPLARLPLSSSSDLHQAQADELCILCKDLTRLSLVPTSIATAFSLRAGGASRRHLHDREKTTSASSTTASVSPVEGTTEHSNSLVASTSSAGRHSESTSSSAGRHSECVASRLEDTAHGTDKISEEEEEDEDESEEEEEENEDQFPAKGTLLHVLYDFEAEDSVELCVLAGQKVRLLCCHDKSGCTDWWLVQHVEGESQGYVPATYVTFQPGNSLSNLSLR